MKQLKLTILTFSKESRALLENFKKVRALKPFIYFLLSKATQSEEKIDLNLLSETEDTKLVKLNIRIGNSQKDLHLINLIKSIPEQMLCLVLGYELENRVKNGISPKEILEIFNEKNNGEFPNNNEKQSSNGKSAQNENFNSEISNNETAELDLKKLFL